MQPDLFGDPPAQRHSPTSTAAAEAIIPHLPPLRLAVLLAIRGAADGLTDEEGVGVTGLSPNTWRPRRVELMRAGLVVDSGRTRRAKSGRRAVVWVATMAKAGDRHGQ